jgi:hypothetical protein
MRTDPEVRKDDDPTNQDIAVPFYGELCARALL